MNLVFNPNRSLQRKAIKPATFDILNFGDQAELIAADGTVFGRAMLGEIAQKIIDDAQRLGLAQGHRIAVILPDIWLSPLVSLALCNLCSVLPINPALKDGEILALMADAKVSGLLGAHSGGTPDARLQHLAQAQGCGLWHMDTARAAITQIQALCTPEAAREAGLVLLTSGSTGQPKRVPLRAAALLHSARTIAQTLHLTAADCAVHALPVFHIGAIVDLFLAPLLAGGRVAMARGPSPEALDHAIRQSGATWVQLVPTMLLRCLDELSSDTLHRWGQSLRFIRSVSADLPKLRHQSAEMALGGLPIIQIYGMTETAGQICSNPLPPGPRHMGTVGPPDGAEVMLVDAVGSPAALGQEGEICLRGPAVMLGYEGGTREEHFWGPWLRSGDLGRFDAAGYLTLTGRVKEMINRGGEKISPSEIERCALALPDVAEAVAYSLPHPTYGEQVGLTVVLARGAALDEGQILAHLGRELAPFKCPRHIDIRAALPRLGSGKIDRLALAKGGAYGKADAGAAAGAAAALTGEARLVADVWRKTLGGGDPRGEDDFFDMGGDSLQATTFLLDLEKALGRPVDANILYQAPRFAALVAALAQPAARQALHNEPRHLRFLRSKIAGWQGARVGPRHLIVAQRSLGQKTPVLFISQGEYAPLIAELNRERPVYLLRSLGGLSGKTAADFADIAQIYAKEISQVLPQGPLHIIGFCDGAKLAHMIGEVLLQAGRMTQLIVSIDYDWPRLWQGPVLHVFSHTNALYRFAEIGLAKLTPNGMDYVEIEGNHIRALRGPSMAALIARIDDLIDGREVLPERLSAPFDAAARQSQYKAAISYHGPRLFRPGARQEVSLTVRNNSAQDWGPTQKSGIGIVADFFNLDGHLRHRRAGHVELHAPILAGSTHRLQMTLEFPPKFLPTQLRLSMTDEGIARFLNGAWDYKAKILWPFGRA